MRIRRCGPNDATFCEEDRASGDLLRGDLDVAVLEASAVRESSAGLTVVPLGELSFVLLAPPSHPLTSRSGAVSPSEIAQARIVTLTSMPGDVGFCSSAVIASVSSIESAERLAESGPFLALLPVVLADPRFHVVAPSTQRTRAVALYRTPLEPEAPCVVSMLVDALRVVATSRRARARARGSRRPWHVRADRVGPTLGDADPSGGISKFERGLREARIAHR